MRIGMIGNFVPQHSTEQDRRWSYEKLGHKVITFQENATKVADIRALLTSLDLLIYSHTHSWDLVGLKELFKECRGMGLPTVSIHLDRWSWLPRQSDIGVEATWATEYIFMADGSPEAVELYKKYDLNWFYLPPGVIERDCYMAEPAQTPEIVFVGSKEYHPEYPFRPKLIEFLHDTYGHKFGHYGNDGIKVVRGDDLNRVYAGAKIAVGDSCFGGRPNYVSDRYFETRGRGGFLLHPHTEGIDTVGVGHYEKENLDSLKETIDYWLAEDTVRELWRKRGCKYVKDNHTYTHRAQEMFDVLKKAGAI